MNEIHTLKSDEFTVRVVDTGGGIWLFLDDFVKSIDVSYCKNFITRLCADEINDILISEEERYSLINDSARRKMIAEFRKPVATRFEKWYEAEIEALTGKKDSAIQSVPGSPEPSTAHEDGSLAAAMAFARAQMRVKLSREIYEASFAVDTLAEDQPALDDAVRWLADARAAYGVFIGNAEIVS